jgi:hypothetical protein
MAIKTYTIYTGMGRSEKFVEILGAEHGNAMNEIGYSGKYKDFVSRQQYLSSISDAKTMYSIHQTGYDSGDFGETFVLTVATQDKPAPKKLDKNLVAKQIALLVEDALSENLDTHVNPNFGSPYVTIIGKSEAVLEVWKNVVELLKEYE